MIAVVREREALEVRGVKCAHGSGEKRRGSSGGFHRGLFVASLCSATDTGVVRCLASLGNGNGKDNSNGKDNGNGGVRRLALLGAGKNVVRLGFAIAIVLQCGLGGIQLRAAQQNVVLDRMLAVVNSDVVTQSDVRAAKRLRLLPGAAAMDDAAVVTLLIERRLMLTEVARYTPIEPTAEAIAARRATWVASLPAGTDLTRELAVVGMTDAALSAWLRDDMRVSAYLDSRFSAAAQPTREQALTYFREHEAEFAKAGVTPAFTDVEAEVRRRVAADRRNTRIHEWVESLKQRAEIRRLDR